MGSSDIQLYLRYRSDYIHIFWTDVYHHAVICVIFIITALNLLFSFKQVEIAELSAVFWGGIIYVGGLLGYLVSIRNLFTFKFTVIILPPSG